MPMAEHFSLKIVEVEETYVVATARSSASHYNPFQVTQGGFAATVLDIVLGLVSIVAMPEGAKGVATTDLSVRYLRSINEHTGTMRVRGSIIHAGGRTIVAESKLYDGAGKLYATAQSTSLILEQEFKDRR